MTSIAPKVATPITTKTLSTTAPTTTSTTSTTLTNAQAQAILQHQPFAPTDVNLFRSGVYAGAAVYQPAPAPSTPATAASLKSFVGSKMAQFYKAMNPALSQTTANSQGQAAASLIDDPTLKKYVPDVRLRAAIASLKGTAADAAIAAIKSGVFKSVTFADLGTGGKGQTGKLPDGSFVMQINSRYQNEDPRKLASIISHEAAHQDTQNSVPEETLNYAVDSMIYGQYVLADSTLPLQKTELGQRENMELMARMNDRDAKTGNLRILTANGSNLYPNGKTTLPTFASAVVVEDPSKVQVSSPGNAYLRSVVKNLTGKDLGASIGFNNTTLKTVDASQTLFTLQQLIQIDKNLKLNVK